MPAHFSRCLVVCATFGLFAASGCRTGRASREVTIRADRAKAPVGSPAARATAPEISPDAFLSHVAFLAHDDLEGRDTGTDGIDIAAGYIAGQFAATGIEPGGVDRTYFQRFIAPGRAELLPETALTISGADVAPALKTDFSPFGFSKRGPFEGDVVFAGYGVTAADQNHDDYKDLDVKDRVVLMLRRQPAWMGDTRSSPHANFESKVKLAASHGATAVAVVNQKPQEGEEDELMPFRSSGADYGLPALHVTREFANKLLAAGGLRNLDELQHELDENKAVVSAPVQGVRAVGTVAYTVEELKARNVIGLLPGMGPHKDEYVVLGGHYDHLGIRREQIHNGADDNASGTTGVILACQALAQAPYRDRSVLCMGFSGEERGLLGSEHYCANPTVPIESIKAMINMDMIGRLNHDSQDNMLGIQGLGTGLAFQQVVDRRTSEAGIKYLPDPSAKGPSDHASFYGVGVPSLFFFTGVHADYHQPGDDTEKVNAAGGAQITKLVYAIAEDLVNAAEAPVYAQVDQPARIMRGAMAQGGGVSLGIMPDMEDSSGAKGWRVARVFAGGGASKAGIKAGDRILLIDGREVNTLNDYRDVTKDKKPGDTIAITLTRGPEQMVLDVELQSRAEAGRRAASSFESGR